MFCTHIYLNGNCREAIEAYAKAFSAEVLTIIPAPMIGKEKYVMHAEILIHNQKLMMNDFGDNEGTTKSGGYQLVVQFENVSQLEEAYNPLIEGGTILSRKQTTDYSPCVVRFIDRFGTRWAFMV